VRLRNAASLNLIVRLLAVRALTSSALVALAVAFLAWLPCYATVPLELPNRADFSMNPQGYRADPYLRTASELQSLDRSAALTKLYAMARDPREAPRVIILARMLFAPRPDSGLRRPMIGGAFFLGGSDYADWPKEPIEIVDGVPFLIANGYILAGLAETSEAYLRYCETQSDWSVVRYSEKTTQEKRDALNMLLTSRKWKTVLTDPERKFLTDQIE
jgi:hypothetical protein